MHVHALKWVAPHTLNCGTYFSFVGLLITGKWEVTTVLQTAQRSWAGAGTV